MSSTPTVHQPGTDGEFSVPDDLRADPGGVDEKSAGTPVTEEQKAFIADFYKYSFVGLMLDWIKRGMQADYHGLVRNISLTVQGSVDNAIRNFSGA